MSYSLTPQARADLNDIRTWYREHRSTATARKVMQDLREQFRRVARTPAIGRPREELAPDHPHLFFWPHRRFLIIYNPETSPLQIYRIWDASRGDPELDESGNGA